MFGKAKSLLIPLLAVLFTLAGCDPQPTVDLATAKAKSEHCTVSDDVNEVRKNHMEAILHHRDETMYKGIRTKQHSLKECINCHVPAEKEGKPVRVTDTENHFCATCHAYTSVKLDCFECHSDRPEMKNAKAPIDATHTNVNAAAAMAQNQGVKQ